MRCGLLLLFFCLASNYLVLAQAQLSGVIKHDDQPVAFAHIALSSSKFACVSNEKGQFTLTNILPGSYQLQISCVGYLKKNIALTIAADQAHYLSVQMEEDVSQLDELVITGTMKEVTKMNSPIPVEVYAPSLFLKNPTPSIFESLSMVNGVQPQINCNVCNTGDIHINGLEGPYTMILIDGMPIVSSLATVYGLAGIPNSLVKRIEIVKGPASTLYGSEAVGGVINIITKDPTSAQKLKLDTYGTSLGEYNVDVAGSFKIKKSSSIIGINYFNFQQKWDINNDNFTDATLQERVSIFNKWNFHRTSGKNFSMAARYVDENRWGGELQWNKTYRGTDIYYGESIYTNRLELLGNYQLNAKQPISVDYSYNYHLQDSYYGTTKYVANQSTAFFQVRWNKKIANHDLLVGLPVRYISYNDNTIGTSATDGSDKPAVTFLPGVFIQDEFNLYKKLSALAGIRYDRHNVHGNIVTPRLSFKFSPNVNNTIRLTSGTGYRVVNLFTEEHAALTGARQVVVKNDLDPERSWNLNLNYAKNLILQNGFINLDASVFYTYFTNKIIGDFITDPEKIIYDNLAGNAISQGATLNADFNFANSLKLLAGGTFMDVYQINHLGIRTPQLHAPQFSGTFTLSYQLSLKTTIDFTGRITGPMHLPVVPDDYRPASSPWFSIANAQVTKSFSPQLEIYLGIKNLFNFIPKDPLLRPFDPFDKNVSVDNPNGYTFDTSYNYAPLQGIRGQIGVRYTIN